MSRQLLQFEKERYEATKENVKNFAKLLVKASEEIERLEVGSIEPNGLKDGNFTDRVLDFYKNEWESNTAFKHVSFEKYLQFIELDLTNLELLQEEYNGRKNCTYSFYPHNNSYFDYCEHRYKVGLEDASNKVEIKIMDMFRLEEKDVAVELDEEYFKLYTTNAKQAEKISDIGAFVSASKKMDLDYKIVKKAAGQWLKDLSYNLESFEIDYYYLLTNIR
ncbi:hypothetical protein FVB32_16115 [Flagellimonas hymeniacidonis]|uniref:Uncharacterized protein n=1 Tax=Flagellimonas hymeniacidonis TaxID=2603628 RepID=A0A5C8V2U6_9FLAO|nr:hypothetical protein [Flagellimonas hymeniacidonis]TXN36083.1 hypothetical protein FVB32_16115 [Flagellimonas hymeniacidonis]